MGRPSRRSFASIVLVLACEISGVRASAGFELQSVSSRPDAVSGGDVLLQLSAPVGTRWSAQLNGKDVTQLFAPIERSKQHRALLSDLKPGRNLLNVLADGIVRTQLELVNHPLSGPVFSGPHQRPFICQTVAAGLGPALNDDCFAKTIVEYYYKSTQPVQSAALASHPAPGTLSPGFKRYDPTAPPSDVAQTETINGVVTDYVVRREVGVINRAIYEIQFLHKPGEPLPSPFSAQRGAWNGRLLYEFKGGCAPGYRQGTLTDPIGPLQEPLLAQGYALVNSTLNSFANNCSDRISAETLAMVKEHFIERFGEPVHTIGWGGSGGAMQVQLIAQNYPGLLDGIVAMQSFPDLLAWLQATTDCLLLQHVFKSPAWVDEQKTAISGYATWHMCDIVVKYKLQYLDPRNCDRSIPKELAYDPVNNRRGARCDLYSNDVNVFGRDPRTGLAHRPLDNVGVQYGLVAFNGGKIDAEQFLQLNETIGGFDQDGNLTRTRTEADPEAVRLAYERGLILTGAGGLSEVPVIDVRPYSDDLGAADGHVRFHSYVTRARLARANGNADNHIILVDTREAWFGWRDSFWGPMTRIVPRMDHWLDNIAADRAPGSRAAKVARGRPSDLQDSCTATDGELIFERASYKGPGRCNQIYPSYGDARMAAGGPLTNDVLKCSLKPIDAATYVQHVSDAQLKRLRAIFPGGVCDYSRPGVGQDASLITWLRF